MSRNLTIGVLARIHQGEVVNEPIVQLLGHKAIQGSGQERYRLMLSDGLYTNSFFLLAPPLTNMIYEKQLEMFTIIKVKKQICPQFAGQTKSVVIILDLEVVTPGSQVCSMIGNPVPIGSDGKLPALSANQNPNPHARTGVKRPLSDCKDNEDAEEISCVLNPKQKELKQLAESKFTMENELERKQKMLKNNGVRLEEKSNKVKEFLVKIDKATDENLCEQNKINKFDIEISALEATLERMKNGKASARRRVEITNEQIQKLTEKKESLDKCFSIETHGNTIQAEIAELEAKIVQNLKETMNVYKDQMSTSPPPDSRQKLLNDLIKRKENDLECPVCLITATVPIYSCPESHLICCVCRPKVTKCPECRVDYGDKDQPRRHRYAERMVEELEMLKSDKTSS